MIKFRNLLDFIGSKKSVEEKTEPKTVKYIDALIQVANIHGFISDEDKINYKIAEILGTHTFKSRSQKIYPNDIESRNTIVITDKNGREEVLWTKNYKSFDFGYNWVREYSECLNEMNEIILTLSDDFKRKYREKLCVLTMGKGGPVDASAEDRAKAFVQAHEN